MKDVDFARGQLMILEAKGDKDRAVPLPLQCRDRLQAQISRARSQHTFDLERGFGRADLPYALRRKYPNADQELAWQYVFFSDKLCRDPQDPDGPWYRHHLHESGLQQAAKHAVRGAGLNALAHRTSCPVR